MADKLCAQKLAREKGESSIFEVLKEIINRIKLELDDEKLTRK